MPDIRPTLGYIRRMRMLESRYLSEITGARKALRRAVMDIIITRGLRMAWLPEIRNELRMLEAKVTEVGKQQTEKIDEQSLAYVNQQMGLLRKIGEPRVPNIQQLNLATYAERKEVYENTLQKSPAWVGDLARTVEMNYTRMVMSGANESAAIDRLLSLKIADGRASAYRLSMSAAMTETKTLAWTASALAISRLFRATKTITGMQYEKQAIAVIDQNTTDCCLMVHGQTQPLDKPFVLYGTPRFADKLDSPPFHWNCRTASSLYLKRMEEFGVSTQEMRDAANAEQKAREEGSKAETHPAHATSRR